jgi:hypothetical protein
MALETLPRPNVELPRSWWLGYYAQRTAGRLLSRIPGYGLHLARLERLIWMMRRAALSEAAYRENRKRALGHGAQDSFFSSGYGYGSETEELSVAKMYKGEALSGQYKAAETPAFLSEAESVLTDLIKTSNPKRIINFGVSYAYLDSLLAAKFPQVKFIGIDRSQVVCDLNAADFKSQNMQFLASDIGDWIASQEDLSDSIFFHMRIGILLPQKFMDELYGKLAAKNIIAICGFEPVGVSRETNTFMAQSYDEQRSRLFRDTLYIHNYAGLCAKRGYKMSYLNYIKTAHIDSDVRMLSFVARRPA